MSQFRASDSRIKQSCRDQVIGLIEANFPQRNQLLSGVTLPGPRGLTQPNGIEQWILNRNPKNQLICVEKNRRTREKIERQAARWGDRVMVFAGTDLDLFTKLRPRNPYNVFFLDWMGALGPREKEALHFALKRGWVDEKAVLATTINASGRCREVNAETFGGPSEQHPQEQALHYWRYLKGLAKCYGWKVSEKSYVSPYSCIDLGRKKVPMLLGYLIGMSRSKRAFSAYEDD